VCGWQVKLCDPLVTHEPYLSALRYVGHYKVLYKFTFFLYHIKHSVGSFQVTGKDQKRKGKEKKVLRFNVQLKSRLSQLSLSHEALSKKLALIWEEAEAVDGYASEYAAVHAPG